VLQRTRRPCTAIEASSRHPERLRWAPAQVSWSDSPHVVVMIPGSEEQRGTDLRAALKGHEPFSRSASAGLWLLLHNMACGSPWAAPDPADPAASQLQYIMASCCRGRCSARWQVASSAHCLSCAGCSACAVPLDQCSNGPNPINRRPLSHNGASLLVTAHMDQFRNDTLTLQVRSPAALHRLPESLMSASSCRHWFCFKTVAGSICACCDCCHRSLVCVKPDSTVSPTDPPARHGAVHGGAAGPHYGPDHCHH
jgi:hypothetical protein